MPASLLQLSHEVTLSGAKEVSKIRSSGEIGKHTGLPARPPSKILCPLGLVGSSPTWSIL